MVYYIQSTIFLNQFLLLLRRPALIHKVSQLPTVVVSLIFCLRRGLVHCVEFYRAWISSVCCGSSNTLTTVWLVAWWRVVSSSGAPSSTFESPSVQPIINLNNLLNECVKVIRSVFLSDLILYVFSQSIIKEFHLAVIILIDIVSDASKFLCVVLSRSSLPQRLKFIRYSPNLIRVTKCGSQRFFKILILHKDACSVVIRLFIIKVVPKSQLLLFYSFTSEKVSYIKDLYRFLSDRVINSKISFSLG